MMVIIITENDRQLETFIHNQQLALYFHFESLILPVSFGLSPSHPAGFQPNRLRAYRFELSDIRSSRLWYHLMTATTTSMESDLEQANRFLMISNRNVAQFDWALSWIQCDAHGHRRAACVSAIPNRRDTSNVSDLWTVEASTLATVIYFCSHWNVLRSFVSEVLTQNCSFASNFFFASPLLRRGKWKIWLPDNSF